MTSYTVAAMQVQLATLAVEMLDGYSQDAIDSAKLPSESDWAMVKKIIAVVEDMGKNGRGYYDFLDGNHQQLWAKVKQRIARLEMLILPHEMKTLLCDAPVIMDLAASFCILKKGHAVKVPHIDEDGNSRAWNEKRTIYADGK